MEAEGFPGFYVPVDKKGANVLVTINSKEPFRRAGRHEVLVAQFSTPPKKTGPFLGQLEGVNWGLF